MKKWHLNDTKTYHSAQELINDILARKNLTTDDSRRQFLTPEFSDLSDPNKFIQMPKAIERIKQAINNDEKIVVHGDYDADGVCASAILVKTLRQCGAKNVSVYLPQRDSGYGFQPETAREFIKNKINLVITCDCGTTNVEAVKIAKAAGLETIITDHHLVLDGPARPEAAVFLNPADATSGYPFTGLCGAGVAYKLAQALITEFKPENGEDFLKWLLGLTAIATIADMMPLTDENRAIVFLGLKALNHTADLSADFLKRTHRLGLWYLMQQAGTPFGKISTTTVEFQIAPRLNAAGRMNYANSAYQLLITDDPAEAQKLAEDLNRANIDRQKMVKQFVAEALSEINSQHLDAKIYWLFREHWPAGLLGLIASQVKDAFNKPTVIFNKTGDKYQASARSPKGFNITEAFSLCQKYISKFGGHAQAAGCTIIGAENFMKAYEAMFDLATQAVIADEELFIDAIVALDFVTTANAKLLQPLAPYGLDNREPLLVTQNLKLSQVKAVGKDGAHCQMTPQGKNWHFVQWQTNNVHPPLNEPLDIAFLLRPSSWQGQDTIEAVITDWRPTN